MRPRPVYVKLPVSATALVLIGLVLSGCQTASMPDITGALGARAEQRADPQQSVDALGDRYRANPKSPEAALRFAQALRANEQRAQAVAVLEQASLVNPGHQQLLAAYGRALAETGKPQQAIEILNRAHSPDNPDWRILSIQGTALDQLGRHDEARRYYASALKIVPEEPSVLSNLGLSYALTRELPKAEDALRRAFANPKADPRVRQNLALVVGLQGRFAEAETIVKADLPPEEAESNVAYLREMLNRKNGSRIGGRSAGEMGRS